MSDLPQAATSAADKTGSGGVEPPRSVRSVAPRPKLIITVEDALPALSVTYEDALPAVVVTAQSLTPRTLTVERGGSKLS